MEENLQRVFDDNSAKKRSKAPVILGIFIFIIAIFAILIIFAPYRTKSADSYVSRGDALLAEKKYVSADVQYQKALILNPSNTTAKERSMLAEAAQSDVLELAGFYGNNPQYQAQLDDLNQAQIVPKTENDALRLVKQYIEKKEYQLAILAAKTATEMDPEYALAWHYLSVVEKDTANLVELTPAMKDKYLADSNEAISKAKTLDPEIK